MDQLHRQRGDKMMEDQEGNVRIETVSHVLIGDKPLSECSKQEIAKEIMALCSRIKQLRQQVNDLQKAQL